MAYCDQLRPWGIFEVPPKGSYPEPAKSVLRYRFRKQSDADAYASVLRQGGGKFDVVFDQVTEL